MTDRRKLIVDPSADRRASALLLHWLRRDDLGLATVLAETTDCPEHAAAVIEALCATLINTLREITTDDEIRATLLHCVARAAAAEAAA
jgi:hypothetical protein